MLIMLVSLYTVRVVLEILGAEDYGIYHVVAGVVTMFGFLSSAMASASQRYFSFDIGRGDIEQLKKTFRVTVTVYALLVLIIVLLAETVGLWFVKNKLIVPQERMQAAFWIYQFAILSFGAMILTAPYMASIIAHENMNVYAYVSIIEAILNLGIVFILKALPYDCDKLIFYGFLLFAVACINTTLYRCYCRKKYDECRFRFLWDGKRIKELVSYMGWNLFGNGSSVLKNQGVNILLNQYFGPVIIAARTISAQINSAATKFSQNFNTAMRPQIIKSYAAGEKKAMLSMMFRGSKGTYLLMYLFVLPLAIETPIVLHLWLKKPPEYAVLFTRLLMFDVLFTSISYPLMAAAQATGKIKMYQSVVGGILLFNLPISLIILLLGAPSYSVMIVEIVLSFFAFMARLLILRRLVIFSIRQFVKIVCIPVCIVSIVSAFLPVTIFFLLPESILRLFLVTGASLISVCVSGYIIGLNKEEQLKVRKAVALFFFKGVQK